MEIGLCISWEDEYPLLAEWLGNCEHRIINIQNASLLHTCLLQRRVQLMIASEQAVSFSEMQQWRERVPDIDWVAVTTTPSYEWAETAMLAGVLAFCALPVSVAHMETLLKHARLQRAYRMQSMLGTDTTQASIDLSHPIESALAYIATHIAEHVTLREVSQTVYLSPSHFSRLFAQKVGMPFNEYVLARRIDAAKTLLTETHLPIELIASKVGISSAAQFSQTFKRITGFSPRAYRTFVNTKDIRA